MPVTVRRYSSGELVYFISSPHLSGLCCPSSSKRKDIRILSRKSRTRLRRYLANAAANYQVMVTLTYSRDFPTDGPHIKADLDRFGKQLRKYELMPASICWFLEFQSRGAPHFHLLATGYIPYQAVAWMWHWATGGVSSVSAGTSVMGVDSGMAGYALKMYGAKSQQKDVPEGFSRVGRWWGVWGDKAVRPLVAATLRTTPDHEERVITLARGDVERLGMRVFDMPTGFVAFPRGRKTK